MEGENVLHHVKREGEMSGGICPEEMSGPPHCTWNLSRQTDNNLSSLTAIVESWGLGIALRQLHQTWNRHRPVDGPKLSSGVSPYIIHVLRCHWFVIMPVGEGPVGRQLLQKC